MKSSEKMKAAGTATQIKELQTNLDGQNSGGFISEVWEGESRALLLSWLLKGINLKVPDSETVFIKKMRDMTLLQTTCSAP